MKRISLLLIGLVACSAPEPERPDVGLLPSGPGWQLLGMAQDGGRPHLGCRKECCGPDAVRAKVSALALVGRDGWWLIDATPDIVEQVRMMGKMPNGILLTHAHVGHYTGLIHLGREAMAADRMPVYCSERMAAFLRSNGPWDQLVRLKQIDLRPFTSEIPFGLEAGLTVTPWRVPHRDEYSDTHAFLVEHGSETLFYCPDIDRWEDWVRPIQAVARRCDVLLLDGTFYSGEELGGRDMSEVPHPTIEHTRKLLAPVVEETGVRLVFIHRNHTNPLWREE